MAECRDFYTRHLGLEVFFETDWFTLLAENGRTVIAYMTPDHPSAPPGPETYSGEGICFEFEVEDAAAAHESLASSGVDITYPLTDEPFGQRRFGFHDPAGVWIDVVQQI